MSLKDFLDGGMNRPSSPKKIKVRVDEKLDDLLRKAVEIELEGSDKKVRTVTVPARIERYRPGALRNTPASIAYRKKNKLPDYRPATKRVSSRSVLSRVCSWFVALRKNSEPPRTLKIRPSR